MDMQRVLTEPNGNTAKAEALRTVTEQRKRKLKCTGLNCGDGAIAGNLSRAAGSEWLISARGAEK